MKVVVLGEGDSEGIVLPRLFTAKGLEADEASIAIVPLGGRHVNHFWRLLSDLNIPFVTLLDLDLARYRGGWGRIDYVWKQLEKFTHEVPPMMPTWDDQQNRLFNIEANPKYINYIADLETKNVFFSSPLDLDFAMVKSYPSAYDVKTTDQITPSESTIKVVLSEHYNGLDQYSENEQKLFNTYQKRFKSNSKPASHLSALSKLEDNDLLANIPPSIERLIDKATEILTGIPE